MFLCDFHWKKSVVFFYKNPVCVISSLSAFSPTQFLCIWEVFLPPRGKSLNFSSWFKHKELQLHWLCLIHTFSEPTDHQVLFKITGSLNIKTCLSSIYRYIVHVHVRYVENLDYMNRLHGDNIGASGRGYTVTVAPADPELPHHPPLSLALFIPLLIPLSNPCRSFHLRSNNISNPYFQPAFPPMAVSAAALEIFNTLYPQFGWVILTKFFFLLCFFEWVREGGGVGGVWGGSMFYFMRLIGFMFFLLYSVPLIYPASCFCFSLCRRWTDQSRWSQQTVRAEEVLYALPRSFSSHPHPPPPRPPPLLPCSFCSNPTNILPVHISLTIMCPIRQWRVRGCGLTARPGQNPQYSEHIMLTVLFPAGVDPSSIPGSFVICTDACTCTYALGNMCVSSRSRGEKVTSFCQTHVRTLGARRCFLTRDTRSYEPNNGRDNTCRRRNARALRGGKNEHLQFGNTCAANTIKNRSK